MSKITKDPFRYAGTGGTAVPKDGQVLHSSLGADGGEIVRVGACKLAFVVMERPKTEPMRGGRRPIEVAEGLLC